MSQSDWVSPWMQALCLPPRRKIAGITCRALSVWHVYILGELDCAYITGGIPDGDAAALLLTFASRSWQDGLKLFGCDKLRARAMRQAYKAVVRCEWDELHDAIIAYITDYTRSVSRGTPAAQRKHNARPVVACPAEWHTIYILCSAYGMTVQEAWDTEYAMARCMTDVHMEQHGDATLRTRDEQWVVEHWTAIKGGQVCLSSLS